MIGGEKRTRTGLPREALRVAEAEGVDLEATIRLESQDLPAERVGMSGAAGWGT